MDDKRQGARRAALTGRRHLPVALVFCAGALLSLSVFLFMRAQERSLLEAELNLHAAKYTTLIQDGIDFNLAMVRATGALYAASDFVDRQEFEVFFDMLQKGRRPGEVQALAWAPRVPDDERDAFEATALLLRANRAYAVRDGSEHYRYRGGHVHAPTLPPRPRIRAGHRRDRAGARQPV